MRIKDYPQFPFPSLDYRFAVGLRHLRRENRVELAVSFIYNFDLKGVNRGLCEDGSNSTEMLWDFSFELR